MESLVKELLQEAPKVKIHGFRLIEFNAEKNLWYVHCLCGAVWAISIPEQSKGIFKMDWHETYAKRTETRVD